MNGNDHAISRRKFVTGFAGLGLLALSPIELLAATRSLDPKAPPSKQDRLSWWAHRGTDFEGAWTASSIEGTLPVGLEGNLFRVGPGTKNCFQTPLTHFFDGDALLSKIRITSSGVSGLSKFVETVERKDEQQNQQMLYNDYGTPSPNKSKGFKNAPSVNISKIGGGYFTLSEAAHPVQINPDDLSTIGSSDFSGGLDSDLSFTAHPRFDAITGNSYAYGISRSLFPKLQLLQIDPNGNLTKLGSYSLGGFYPVHDMMVTKNYVVFLVSPFKIDLIGAALGTKPIAELLQFMPDQPLRIVIFNKDGSGSPVEIDSSPGGLTFHSCNAYEDHASGNLVLDSIVADNFQVFAMFQSWSSPTLTQGPQSWITRFTIDISKQSLVSREKLSDGVPIDFPAVDTRLFGQSMPAYCTLQASGNNQDYLSFDSLVRWDLMKSNSIRVVAGIKQTFGEPVYVPSNAGDYILHLGYDGAKDQTFLDVRSSLDLTLMARVWFGFYLPIGFHGHFESAQSANK